MTLFSFDFSGNDIDVDKDRRLSNTKTNAFSEVPSDSHVDPPLVPPRKHTLNELVGLELLLLLTDSINDYQSPFSWLLLHILLKLHSQTGRRRASLSLSVSSIVPCSDSGIKKDHFRWRCWIKKPGSLDAN